MLRYYFDTDDGTEVLRDDRGLDLPNDQAARDQGARGMAELAKEYIPGAQPQKNITMWVRTANGEALLQMSLSFSIKPLKET